MKFSFRQSLNQLARAATSVTPFVLGLFLTTARADERRFAYSYEPETMPKGGMEYEQWVTLGTQRTKNVGQQNYNLWEIREALEFGITDNYTLEFYLNQSSESYRDPTTGDNFSEFKFQGISLENRYMVLNPANHAVGLTLYLEPTYAGDSAEIEEKIILGQRYGNWKWAFNLSQGTEWTDNFHKTEGELAASFGIARDLSANWSLGLEILDHNEIPDYKKWENTALFVGPVVSYRKDKWWGTFAVLPQVYGKNFGSDPDGYPNLELEGHEWVNIRLILGFDF